VLAAWASELVVVLSSVFGPAMLKYCVNQPSDFLVMFPH
jgi:hypothetical protein